MQGQHGKSAKWPSEGHWEKRFSKRKNNNANRKKKLTWQSAGRRHRWAQTNNEKSTYCNEVKLNLGQVTLACATVSTIPLTSTFFPRATALIASPLHLRPLRPAPYSPACINTCKFFLSFLCFFLLADSFFQVLFCSVLCCPGIWPLAPSVHAPA